jgi:hypothetical protein
MVALARRDLRVVVCPAASDAGELAVMLAVHRGGCDAEMRAECIHRLQAMWLVHPDRRTTKWRDS